MPDGIGDRRVVLWALTGSRSYGLQTEGSDEDHIALVAPTFDDLYGGTMFSRQSITLAEDILAYDVRRLPELLWKSNPSFLEMLFSPEIAIPDTPAADAMRWTVSERDRIARMNLPKLWSATLGIYAFVAAVLGGIGSLPGAMLGGLLIGIVQSGANTYISSSMSDTFVYLILIVVLMLRPAGILGKNVGEKV